MNMDTNKIELKFYNEAKAEQELAQQRAREQVIAALRTAFPGASMSGVTDKSAALRQLGFFAQDWSGFTDEGWEKIQEKAGVKYRSAVDYRQQGKRSTLLDLVSQIESLLEYAGQE